MGTGKKILLGFVVSLLAGRMALPWVVKSQVNKQLATLTDFKGHVEDVDLAVWRGGIELQRLEILHKKGDLALTIPELAIGVRWPHLIKRELIADVRVQSPRLRMLVQKPLKGITETKEKAKDVEKTVEAKTGKSLPDLLAELMPFQIRNFYLTDGTIRVQETGKDLSAQKEKDKDSPKGSKEGREAETAQEARVSDLQVEVHNLTNRAALSGSPTASGSVTARVMGDGKFKMNLKLNPVAKYPTFDIDVDLTKLNLVELNPLFRWQWGIDVKKGTFAMFMEAGAKEGGFKGYVKPFLHDVDVLDGQQDKHKSLGKKIKEAVVDAVASVLENKTSENVATRIPFEGRFDDPKIGIWQAVVSVLRNGFVKALSPRLDRTIN